MLSFLKEYSGGILKGNIPGLASFQYYKRWKHLLGKNPVNEKLPWITFKAIDFIEKNLKSTDKVFEYGGGGSTLYFLNRVSELVTVEHDKEWFQSLQTKIDAGNNTRWHGQFILPEKHVKAEGLDKSDPADYFSGDPEFQDVTFKAYSTFICQFKDEYFDIVLIDGRARASCLFHAMPKVKVGGFLVLDNSERKYYLRNILLMLKKHYRLVVNHMGPVPYSASFSQTSIWERIK
jgi:hypothetical protein